MRSLCKLSSGSQLLDPKLLETGRVFAKRAPATKMKKAGPVGPAFFSVGTKPACGAAVATGIDLVTD